MTKEKKRGASYIVTVIPFERNANVYEIKETSLSCNTITPGVKLVDDFILNILDIS